MNFRIPVKCVKKVEENGGYSMTLALPPDAEGKDALLFSGSREMTYKTHDRTTAAEFRTGETLYFALFTSDHK